MPPSWEVLLALVGIPFVLLFAVGIRRRREGIRHKLRAILVLEIAYLSVAFVLVNVGVQPVAAILIGLLAAFALKGFLRPRSRYIPARERRKAIARHELETGKKFNPRTHELDHVVPFSKGGSSTADNLRVTEKKSNRAKGAKSPWWDVLGR
jgi:hypothetical protein